MGLRPPAASAALSRSSSMPLPLGSLALLAIGSLTAVLGKHRGRGAKVRVRVAPRPKVLRLAAVASEAAAPTSVDEDLVCLATVVSFSAPPLLLKAPLPHSAPLAGTAEGEKARGLGCCLPARRVGRSRTRCSRKAGRSDVGAEGSARAERKRCGAKLQAQTHVVIPLVFDPSTTRMKIQLGLRSSSSRPSSQSRCNSSLIWSSDGAVASGSSESYVSGYGTTQVLRPQFFSST